MTNFRSIQGSGGGGGGGGGCFLGHTMVRTPSGEQRIDQLKPGDQVLSFDDHGIVKAGTVLKVHEHENERVIRYGLWGGTFLDATPNHWVLNQFNAFVEIGTLGADDCLVDENNHLRPIVSKTDLCNGTVYNLTVEGHHTFIAGGIRVHNAGLGAGIAGSGGGGGGGKGGGGQAYVPTEADDSLQSVQYGSVLDLLSEGEIEGIEGGVKGIYLDGTPIQSSTGTDNFTGYTVVTRNGTQAQAYIPNTNGTESEKAVNVEATASTSVTRTISDTDVDRVRVTVQMPACQIIEDDGDIIGNSVDIQIQVQYNSGGFTTVVSDTISGKTTNSYQRDYMLTLSGAFPVDIRLVRVSPDSGSARRQNRTYLYSYTEIIDEKLRYPNSALTFLRFDSRQFNSIPSRKYLVRGIKIQLPSNATVDITNYLGRVTYSGVWDGTFGAATWCADPAWCLWDLLTNTRYGASIPASSLDRYDFYSISQYCNGLVSDGKGGQEPRFLCNLLLNSRDEVYNVIQEFTALFRGIAYYGAGTLVVNQDKPSDPQYVITAANVIDGIFNYSGTSQKARASTATIGYQTYEGLGEVEFEYVEDAEAIAKYGIINRDVKLLGCYSQGQAHRAGKWTLLSEQNLTETVTFAVSLDSGIVLRPGMVISVADPLKAASRRGGRVSSATTTAVTIDSTEGLSVTVANGATLTVMMPTGLVETRNISSIVGRVVTVTSAFSEAPNAQSVWVIETTDVELQTFRVITVTESEPGVFGVTALAYNETIYDAIENDLKLEARDITSLSTHPEPVQDINGVEFLYEDGQSVFTGFDLSWISPVQYVAGFRVQHRLDNNNWITTETTSPSLRIGNLHAGRLEVQIQALNSLGNTSVISPAVFNLVGKTAVPGNVQNLSIESISANSARLRWDQTVDLDVKTGGFIKIRHSAKTDGTANWSDSIDLIPAKSGAQTEAIVPLLEGEILVKFQDDGGRQSTDAASVIVDFPDAIGSLPVQTRREDQDTPPFQGTKTSVFYSEELDGLTLEGTLTLDEITDFDLISAFDYLGDVSSEGTYQFKDTLDLGAVFSLDLSRYFVTRGFFPNDLIDSRTAEIDTWSDFDGAVNDSVNATLYLRRTNDDPTGTPTWSDYQPFVNGTFLGRAFEFKAVLTTSDAAENILIDELGYESAFQRRSEQSNGNVASGAGTATVTFDKAFFVGTAALGGLNAYLPSIGITAQNMATGDYFTLGTVTGTNFQVTFRNAAGTAVNRNFTWSAVGYGKSV
jgi:predicted phage tail protein